MPSIAPVHLSGSTSGAPVVVAATSIGSGTTIHTAVSGSTSFDSITLVVTNTDTAVRTLTLGWGGTTDPDSLIYKGVSIPASSGAIPIVTGLRLNGGLIVKAASDSASKLLIDGTVDRYTP
jgi:hypothetical protein